MEQTPNQNYLSNDLTLDAVANAHLKETAMWGKFLGITGMVVSVLFIIFGFFAGADIGDGKPHAVAIADT